MGEPSAILQEFRLSLQEEPAENIRRILRAETGYILDQCGSDVRDIHRSVHEIRKSIKRIRSVFRLIRDEIGYSTYYRENVYYRDINRKTSGLRSAGVLLDTLDRILADMPGTDALVSVPLREDMVSERDRLLEGLNSDSELLSTIARKVEKARERIEKLPFGDKDFKVFHGGLHRIYRKGRKYLSASMADPGDHILHDLRKRVKYLWYHMEILNPTCPKLLKAYAVSLEEIADSLGQYHDLSALESYIEGYRGGIRDDLKKTLVDACIFRKEALLPDIFSRSKAVYAEKPDPFLRRMNDYWKIAYKAVENA